MNKLWMVPLLLAAALGVNAAPAEVPAPPTKSAIAAVKLVLAPVKGIDIDNNDDGDDVSSEGRGADLVAVGHDVSLAAGATAKSVVALLGSATSDGTAREVVAVIGDATVKGPVDRDVVAIMGDVKLDNTVGHDVVAVLGSVELGPNARVGHDVVVIGGTLTRDPAATIGHSTNVVTIGHGIWGGAANVHGLRAWVRKCLFLGRPLALDREVGWAWGVACAFLALYVLMALLFRTGMDRCVRTFQTRPGTSLLTALASIVLTPVAIMVLVLTVVGILFVPVLGIVITLATLFGKAVVLAWIGQALISPLMQRDAGQRAELHPAIAVIVGGIVMMALYVIPFFGFLIYKLTDLLGLGIVLLTLLLALRTAREARKPAPPAPATAPAIAMTATDAGAAGAEATGAAAAPAAATAPAIQAHAGMERATFWQRMAALFLDLVLMLVLIGIVSGLNHGPGRVLPVIAIYGCIMWVVRGTTVGGSVLGIHVVRLDGRPIDWGTGIVRALGCFLSLFVAGLGFIWIAFDAEKQAWHDKIAGTVVVRRPGGNALV